VATIFVLAVPDLALGAPEKPAGGVGYFPPDDPRVLSAAALLAALGVGVITVPLVVRI
jgi:hypothetical protein